LQVSTLNRQHTLSGPPEGQEGMQFNDIFPAAKLHGELHENWQDYAWLDIKRVLLAE
jgi:hypothetical protein